jgi:Tol biopolymer transport system component
MPGHTCRRARVSGPFGPRLLRALRRAAPAVGAAALVASALLGGAAPASAQGQGQVLIYDDPNAFVAALNAGAVNDLEQFDTFFADQLVPTGTVIGPPPGTVYSFVDFLTGFFVDGLVTDDFQPVSGFNTLGRDLGFAGFNAFSPGDFVILEFPQPVEAVGSFFATGQDFGDDVVAVAIYEDVNAFFFGQPLGFATSLGFFPGQPGFQDGELRFLGMVSATPFRVAVLQSNPFLFNLGYVVDDIITGTARKARLTLQKSGAGGGSVMSSDPGIECFLGCSADNHDYLANTVLQLVAAPAPGSTFAGFSGAGCDTGAGTTVTVALTVDTTCTATFGIGADPTLTVTKAGAGSGAVSSAPAGLSCGPACPQAAQPFPPGTAVTLTATAAPGSAFAGFGGDPDCVDGLVVMLASRSCVATFVAAGAATPTLSVARAGVGAGTVTSSPPGISCGADCAEQYPGGTVVVLSATPAAGSVFGGFGGDPDCADGMVTLGVSRSCVAAFFPVQTAVISTGANAESVNPSLSADGRFVAFESTATTLDPACGTGVRQIFLKDRMTGEVICVSRTNPPGDQASDSPVVSPDGGTVAFRSTARNLAAPCNTGIAQIFVWDRQSRAIACVTIGTDGRPGDVGSGVPALSDDGRVIAFESEARNLTGDCRTGVRQVFVRDRTVTPNATTCLSVSPGGAAGNGASGRPAISGSGNVVAFESAAGNLVAADCTTGLMQIFVRVRDAAATSCVSVSPLGAPGDLASRGADISADGNKVAFESSATNLVASGCTDGTLQIFLRNRVTGVTTCVSVGPGGVPGNQASSDAAISRDGSTVAFRSAATNLTGTGGLAAPAGVLAQAASGSQIFSRNLDQVEAQMRSLTQTPSGSAADGVSLRPRMNRDGTLVAFQSTATNLGQGGAAGQSNVFVAAAPSVTTPVFTLSVTRAGSGTGTVTSQVPGIVCGGDCAEGYPAGAVVILSAAAADGSIFAGWSGAGCGGTGICQVIVTADLAVTATFSSIGNQVALMVLKTGGGTGTVSSQPAGIDCGAGCPGLSAAFASGAQVTLSAVPAAGHVFGGFSGGGCSGTDPCVVTLAGSTTVVAFFAPPGQPVIVAPIDGTRFALSAPTPVTVAWTAVAGAVSYGFEFTGTNLQFWNPNGNAPDTVNGFGGAGGALVANGTSLTVPLDPATPPGAYQARVIGLTAQLVPLGTFSNAITVNLGPPPPAFTAPASGAVLPRGAQAVLAWTVVPGATQYLFEFSIGGVAGSFPVGGPGLTVVVPPDIQPGTYQLRVLALGAAGQQITGFGPPVSVTVQ